MFRLPRYKWGALWLRLKSYRMSFYYCSLASFSEHSIILIAAIPKVSENLFFVISMVISIAVRSQVHMLWKWPNIFMVLLRHKKPWYMHNVKSLLFFPAHYSSRFPKGNYSKHQVILYLILIKKRESNFPTVPSYQSFWKISLTVSLRHYAWTRKYPKGIPSYARATAISYVKCDF